MTCLIVGDTETTGIDPSTGHLLELGFIVADEKLNKIGSLQWLWPSSCGEAAGPCYQAASPKVQKMHTDNGLWQDLYQSGQQGGRFFGCTNEDVVRQVLELFGQMGVSANSQATLIGRKPSFDLDWLGYHAKPIADLFHYQTIDIVAMQKIVQTRYGQDKKWKEPQPHRVLGDCENELEELKYYINNFMVSV